MRVSVENYSATTCFQRVPEGAFVPMWSRRFRLLFATAAELALFCKLRPRVIPPVIFMVGGVNGTRS